MDEGRIACLFEMLDGKKKKIWRGIEGFFIPFPSSLEGVRIQFTV